MHKLLLIIILMILFYFLCFVNNSYSQNYITHLDNSIGIALRDSLGSIITSSKSIEDSLGRLIELSENIVDADCSTTNNLDADSTFTGDWIDTLNYGVVIISVISDQASATDGLCVDWSNDGITKTQDDTFTISANNGKVFTFSPASRYMRIVYTNGSITQTSFTLQTIFKRTGFKASSHRIQDHIVAEDDAELVKAVLTAQTTSDTFINMQATDPGNLRVTSKPFQYDVVVGNITGFTAISKFGYNPTVGTALEEVWDRSIAYVYMETDSTLYISSSNSGDDQDYEIQGLDASWTTQIDTITVAGYAAVAIDGTWIRVFRMKNLGSTNNAGNIIVYTDSTGITGDGVPTILTSIKAQITALMNQTLMAIYSIPDNGTTAYITDFYGSTSSSKATEIHLYARLFGGVFQIKKILVVFEGTARMDYNFPFEVPAKSDIVIKAITSGGGGVVSAGFDLWYQ